MISADRLFANSKIHFLFVPPIQGVDQVLGILLHVLDGWGERVIAHFGIEINSSTYKVFSGVRNGELKLTGYITCKFRNDSCFPRWCFYNNLIYGVRFYLMLGGEHKGIIEV